MTMTTQDQTADHDPLSYFRRRYCEKRSEQVGTVGTARKSGHYSGTTTSEPSRNRSDQSQLHPACSDRSDDTSSRSEHKNTNKTNDVPTGPTVPTQNDLDGKKQRQQELAMPKCTTCKTSIPVDRIDAISTDDGQLAHPSCAKLGLPRRRSSSRI